MSEKLVLYTKEGSIATVVMNSPKTMNALEEGLVEGLIESLGQAADDPQVGAVILTGVGKAFCAGGDLRAIGKGFTVSAAYDYIKHFHKFVKLLYELPKPVITAVNGHAAGAGFCIALLGDIVVASENAKFSTAFVKVGAVPDLGGLYVLPRLVGLQKAKELVFTGRTVGAEEAVAIGLATKSTSAGDFEKEVRKLAEELAAGPRITHKLAKALLNTSLGLSMDQLLEMEAQAQALCFQTEDSKNAIASFFKKEAPVFHGK
ncbi:MAG: enoyl-CoA hydratase/isomerase family protein [Fusobacteriaceae bacterium]|jgi:2-(1,2-epoxy-1,2-dihydrophenyl)acetyl-CoA isomerase|nr:enoyl-CoA hydratase/isomerase family protein [Fusobacteriaceae bacterium]